jgi:uncharacterized protein YlxW (UPF0749 family)
VGPAIQVNEIPLTPPYTIRAIGDPATLSEALALPGGVADQMRQTDPAMIGIAKHATLLLPSYDGSTLFRYCKPVKDVSSTSSNGGPQMVASGDSPGDDKQ